MPKPSIGDKDHTLPAGSQDPVVDIEGRLCCVLGLAWLGWACLGWAWLGMPCLGLAWLGLAGPGWLGLP